MGTEPVLDWSRQIELVLLFCEAGPDPVSAVSATPCEFMLGYQILVSRTMPRFFVMGLSVRSKTT